MFFGCKKKVKIGWIVFCEFLLHSSLLLFLHPLSFAIAKELPLCSIDINRGLAPDIYFDFKQSIRDESLTLKILREKYGDDIVAEPNQVSFTMNLFRPLKYDGNNINTAEFSIVDFNKGDMFTCDINKLVGCNETSSEDDYIEKQKSFVELDDQMFDVCGKDYVETVTNNNSNVEINLEGENQTITGIDRNQIACINQQTGQITCGNDNKCNDSGDKNIKGLYCDNGVCSSVGNFSIRINDNKYIVEQIKNCFPKNHICYFYKKDIDLYYMIDKYLFDSSVEANKSFYIYEKDALYGNSKNDVAGSFKFNCTYDLFKCDFSVVNESNKAKEKNVVYLNSSSNADNIRFIENINSGLGKMAFFKFLGSCNYTDNECQNKVKAENYYKYINPVTKIVYYFEKNFRSQKGIICDGYLPNCKDVLQPIPLYNDVINSDDNNRKARDDFYLANANAENRTIIRTSIKGENKTSIGVVVNEANMWFVNSNNFANSNCLSVEGKITEAKNGKSASEVYSYKGYCSDLTEDKKELVYPNGLKDNNCYFKSCIDLTPKEISVILSKGGSGKFCSEYTWLNNKYGFKYFPKENPVFCNEVLANGELKFPQGFEVNNPKCYLKNCFSIDDNGEREAIIYSRYKHFLNKVGWVYNVGKYADGMEHSFNDYYYVPKYCYRGIFFTKDMIGFGGFNEINFNVNFCNDFSLEQLSSINSSDRNIKNKFIGLFSEFFTNNYDSNNVSYFCRTHIVPYSVQQESENTSFLRNTLIGLDERNTENIKELYKDLYNSLYYNIGGYDDEKLFANESQHNINLKINDSNVYGKIESNMVASNPEFNSMINYCYSVDNLFLFQDTSINNLSNKTYSIQVTNPYKLGKKSASVEVVTFSDRKNDNSFVIENDSGFGNYLEDIVVNRTKKEVKDDKGNVIDTKEELVYDTQKREDSAGINRNYSYYEILVNRIQNKAINYKTCILSGISEIECKNSYSNEAKYYDVENMIFQNLINCSMYNSNYNIEPLSVVSYFDCDLYSNHGRPYSLIQPYFTKLYPIHSNDSETYNNFISAIGNSCDRLYTIPEEKNTVIDKQDLKNIEVLSALIRPYISTNTQQKYLNNFSSFNSEFKDSSTSDKFKSSDRGLAGCAETEYSRSDTIGLRYPRNDSLYFAYGEKMIDKTTNNGAIIPAGKKFFNKDFKYDLKLCLRESKESNKCGRRENDKYSDKCIAVNTGNYIDKNGIYSSGDSISTTTDTYYSSVDTGRNVYYIQRIKANDFMNATESSPYLDFMAIEKITDLWGDLVYMGVFSGTFVTTLIGMSAKCAWDAMVDECKFNPFTTSVDIAKNMAAFTVYTTFLLPRKNEWYSGYEGTLIYPYNYYNYIKSAKKKKLETDSKYAEKLKADEKDVINTKEVDVEEGFLSKITLTNNDNYYYNYYPRSINIAEDIKNKLTYNIDSDGNRFFHKTSRSYDILKHCEMTDMLIDKNDCLNDRIIPEDKQRSVNANDFMDILVDKMWRTGCFFAKPFITFAGYFSEEAKKFQCYNNEVIWKGQSNCEFAIRDYNSGDECTVNGDYTRCLTDKQKKCLNSFGVEFLDLNKLLDPRYKDFESKSVFKRYEEMSTYNWLENQKKIITFNFASDPNEIYQVPVNIITLSKYSGKEEDLINNENCLLNKYGSPIGDLAKCRGVFYSNSSTELNNVNNFTYKTYETILSSAETYEIDDIKGSDSVSGTFYTESQAVSKPLASSPPLFFNLVTPNNIPEIFMPIFFLKRFRNYRDVVKDATYIDSAVLDFFNPQLHFLYDYQQSNDVDMENKYSDYYEKNDGKTTRHLIDFGRQYSNPYLLKYSSRNEQRNASFRFILEKKYDGDFNKTYSPTVCAHMTILPNNDGANRCLTETRAPVVGSSNTSSFVKEEVKLCGANSKSSCGNFDDIHQSGDNDGKCVSSVYNDYYCYTRKLPNLKTNLIIKQDSKINYLFPVINAFIKPAWDDKEKSESFSNFNKSEYILSRFSTGIEQEIDVKTNNMTQISGEAINYTQAIGLKFERSMCSAMTYEYYKYTDMLLKERAKDLDKQDIVKMQKYQDKINYFEGILQPECDRLGGYKGQILINDSVLLPYKTTKDISKVVYMETKPIKKNPSVYGAFNEICLSDSIIEHFNEAGSIYNPTLLENVIVFKNLDSTSTDKTKCLLTSSSLLNENCLEDDVVYEYCEAGTFNCERKFNLTKNEFEYVRKIECRQLMEKLRDNIELWEFNIEDIRACYKGGFNMNGNVYKKDGSGLEYSCSCRYEKDMINYNKDLFKVRKITARELGFCVNLEDAPTCPAVKYYGSNKEYIDDNLALGKTDDDYAQAYKDGDTSIYEQHIWRTNELQFGYIPSVFFSNNLGNAEFEKSNYCSNIGEELLANIKVNCNPKTRNISMCESQLSDFFDKYSVDDKVQQQEILSSCKSNEAGQYSICTNALDLIDSNYSNNMCIGGNKIIYGSCNGYWNINVSGLKPQAICSKYDYTTNDGNKKTVYEYRLVSNPCERYRCEGIGYYDNGKERAVDERDAIRKTSTLFRDDEIDAYNQKVITRDFNIPYVDEETDISKVDRRGSSNGFAIWPETISGDVAKKTTATQCLTGYGARDSNYYYNESLDNGFSNSYYIDHTMIIDTSDSKISNRDLEMNKVIELERDKTDFMVSNIFPVTQHNLPFRYCDQKGNWMVVNDIYNRSKIPQDKMYYYRNNTFWENRTKELSFVDTSIGDNGYYCERLICRKIDKDYINNENVYSKEYLNIGEKKTFDKIKFWKHSGGAIWDTVGASRNSSNLLDMTSMFDKANMNLKYIYDDSESPIVRSEYKYLKRFNEGICYTDFGYFNRGTKFQGDGSFSSQISILLGTQNIVEPIKPQYTPMIVKGIKTTSPERACDSNGTWTGIINNCFRACEMLDIYRTNVSPAVMDNNLDKTKYIENHDILSVKVDKYNVDTEKMEKEQKFVAYGLGTKQELIDLNKISAGGYYYGDFVTGGATWPRTIVSNDTINRDNRNGLRYVEVEGICDASYEGDKNKIRQYINSADSNGNTIKPKRRCYEDGTWGAVYDNTQCVLAKSCVELQITLKNLKQLIDAYNEGKSLLEMNGVLASDIVYDNERERCVVCENIDMINNRPNSSTNDCAVSHSLVTNGSMARSLSDENNIFYVANAWKTSKQNFICNRSNQNSNYQPGWNIKNTNIDEYFIPKTCNAQFVKNKNTVSNVFKDGLKSRRAVISLYPTRLSYTKETNLEFISKNATILNSNNEIVDNIHYYGRYYNNLESKVNYLASISGNTNVKDRSDRNIKIGRSSYESFQIVNHCDRTIFYNKLDFDGYTASSNDEYYDKNIVLECRLDDAEEPRYHLLKDESKITLEERKANLYPEGTYMSRKDARNIITDFDECLPMSCGENAYQFNASVSTVKEFDTGNYGEYGSYGMTLVNGKMEFLNNTHTSEISCDGDGYAFIIDTNDPDGKYDVNKAVYYDISGDTTIGRSYHFVKKFTGLICSANKLEKNKINGQVIVNGKEDYDGTYYDYQRYGELDVSSIPKRFCKDIKKGDSCKTLTQEEILSNNLKDGGNFKNEYCVFIGCRMNNLIFSNDENDGKPTIEIPAMNKTSAITTFSLNSSVSDKHDNEFYGTNLYPIYKAKIGTVHVLESLQNDYIDVGNKTSDIRGITIIHSESNKNYNSICGSNRDIYYSGTTPYNYIDNFIGTFSTNQQNIVNDCFSHLKNNDNSLSYSDIGVLSIDYETEYKEKIDIYDKFYTQITDARLNKITNNDVVSAKSKTFIMNNIVYPFFEDNNQTYVFDNDLLEYLINMRKIEREKINKLIFTKLDDLYSKYIKAITEQKVNEYQSTSSNDSNNSLTEEEKQWFIVKWDDGTMSITDNLLELSTEENSSISSDSIELFKEFLDDSETIEDYKIYYREVGEMRKYYIGKKFKNISIEIQTSIAKDSSSSNDESSDTNIKQEDLTNDTNENNTTVILVNGEILFSVDMYYNSFRQRYDDKINRNGTFMNNINILVGMSSSVFDRTFKYYKNIYFMEYFLDGDNGNNVDLYDYYWEIFKEENSNCSIIRTEILDDQAYIEGESKYYISCNSGRIQLNLMSKVCTNFQFEGEEQISPIAVSCSEDEKNMIINYLNSKYLTFLNNPSDGGAEITKIDTSTCEGYYKQYLDSKNQYNSQPHKAEFYSGLFMALRCKPDGWQVIGQPVCKDRCWGSVLNDHNNNQKTYSCDHTLAKITIDGLRYGKSVDIPTVKQFEQDGLREKYRGYNSDWVVQSKSTFTCKSGEDYKDIPSGRSSYGSTYRDNVRNFVINKGWTKKMANVVINYENSTMPRNVTKSGWNYSDSWSRGSCCQGSDSRGKFCWWIPFVGTKCSYWDWCISRGVKYNLRLTGYIGRSGYTSEQGGCTNSDKNTIFYMCPDGSIGSRQIEDGGPSGCVKSPRTASCSSKFDKGSMSVRFEFVPAGKYDGGVGDCMWGGIGSDKGCMVESDPNTAKVLQ